MRRVEYVAKARHNMPPKKILCLNRRFLNARLEFFFPDLSCNFELERVQVVYFLERFLDGLQKFFFRNLFCPSFEHIYMPPAARDNEIQRSRGAFAVRRVYNKRAVHLAYAGGRDPPAPPAIRGK